MKRLLSFFAAILAIQFLAAQYCGTSGPSVCTPQNLVQPGLFPLSPNLPPLVNGQISTTVIEFKNFDSVFFDNSWFVLQELQIDTISNLPAGLCWATDQPANTYGNQQNGCIVLNGTPCATPGQYKLHIIVNITLPGGITIDNFDADNAALYYFLRIDNQGEAVTPVDTFQTASNPFEPYGPAAFCPAPPIQVSLGGNQTVCNGSYVSLQPAITNGVAPFTYLWQSTGDALSCDTCLSPSTTITQNSTFILIVTDANDSTGRDTITYTSSGVGINYNITAAGPSLFCLGDSVLLTGSTGDFTYVWTNSGDTIAGAGDSIYAALTAGTYQLHYTAAGGCQASSNLIQLTTRQSPVVSLALSLDSVCKTGSPVSLSGGTPGGGRYSGAGVSNSVFNPDSANTGLDLIMYTYTDSNGCASSATDTVKVSICTGISELALENSVSVYPNPANDVLILESSLFTVNTAMPLLYDVTGKIIPASFARQAGKFVLNTARLAPGMYWITMNMNGMELSKKFVRMQ